ncbi:lysophospholipid acyltransferase family protein [Geothrix fermentans]|jgi:1-acyl-sn-glycerol-3-phosphate acyltransferase|uniref:lysophospholipid acyltransferase family protein n=1 Tax=Geothrix fermentans TaxID=44676 RepID=UPI000401FE9D|nr:lysophospholipid acyltransferase family protein [Geothrix fermentans]
MSGRPFLRPLLVWILGALALALSVCLCFLLAPFLGGPLAFWLVAPRYIRGTARAFGIRRELEGWEALPADLREGRRPAVFIGNHTSLFDPPLMISTLPCRPVFVAKRELAGIPFLGWVIWLADFIFIDRRDGASARASLAEATARIRAGQAIVAFPEGTRSRDGRLLPFKKGPFALAFEAGVPLVPFAIHGGPEILPKGAWRVRGGAYRITMGQPLEASAFADSGALREAAESAVRDLLGLSSRS